MDEMQQNQGTPDQAPDPKPAAVPVRPGKALRYALVASLAVNLLVLGIVGGAVLKHGPRPMMEAGGEVGFGPLTEALSGDDRRALREDFFRRMPGFREARREARDDFEALVAVLRAPVWDEAKARAVIAGQRARTEERIALGQDLLLQRVGQMTAEERAAFADRIEQSIRRFQKKD